MKVALVIGHRPMDPGAVNVESGETEFAFNRRLATDISTELGEMDIPAQIVYREDLAKLPRRLNEEIMPTFIVSLHCNAFDTRATGTETLYYHTSDEGRQMAEILQRHIVEALLLRDRGIQPKRSEDRGGFLLRYTHAPCIIAEPFFIDNDNDLRVAEAHYHTLVYAYASAIEEIAGVIHA